jgi:isopentenyl diphosphate isomerase/L-lactate dehydrogenase-like FMN-dependent dehydrogenase
MKGIMMAEDVILAIEAGADGIMTSSYGERHLD